MVKRNKVSNMDNNDEFTIKVEDPNSSTVESNTAKTSKKVQGGLKKPKLESENELKPPKSNDPNISEHQLNDLNRSNSSVSRLEKWTQPREVDYLFAARLVKDARDLRNLTFKKTEHNLKSYERYLDIKMAIVVYVTIFVHLMLPLIEEPAVWPTPYWVPCCIELICLCVYTLRWINARSFQTRESFRIDKKNFIVLVIIILIFLDIVAFIAVNATEVGFRHRFTRPLRVLIYINFNEGKELRRAIRNVRKTLPDIFNVFALFFLSLFMFAFVGWNLLRGRPGNNASLLIYSNNQSYFQNFEDSIWDLYISITTANFPDVMMPAYDVNGAYSIFFISFMLINLYIFINIILATIYTNYKKHLKEEVRLSLELRRNKIKDAFDLIKFPLKNLPEMADFTTTEYIRNEYEYVVNFDNFTKLMKNVKERINDKQMNILFDLLDIDGNRLLAFKEFVFLPDLLNIRLTELKDRQVIFEQLIPDIYNSKPSKILKKLVRHKIFQMFFDILILINMIFVFLQFSEDIEWFFLVAYLIEIFLKIYECGLVKFVNDYWNVFDSLIVFSGIIAGLVDEITGVSESKSGGAGIFEIVLILRSLRLIKFVASVHRFRTIITTIAIITPSLINYAMLLLTIFYLFSMVGMEIFGTTIQTQQFVDRDSYNCFNPRLKDTDFVRFKYCKNNFSSFPNSLVLLFELMVVNQWHVLSRGFEDAMGSKFTRFFFLAFHISCVIVSLNIFTAFVIEAFLLEYENSDELTLDSKLETRIKKLGLNFESEPHDESSKTSKSWDEVKKFFKSLRDIVNVDDEDESPTSSSVRRGTESEHKSSLATQGVRFHINSKEPKSVDVLLQRMFSNEFDITQDDLLIANNNN